MTPDRVEAIVALGVSIDDLDPETVSAIAVLSEASAYVAVGDVENANDALDRITRPGPGWIIVADADQALMAATGRDPPSVVWERGSAPFEEWLSLRLWQDGIAPHAVGHVEKRTTGEHDLRQMLAEQLYLRACGAVPRAAPVQGWAVELGPDAAAPRHVHPSVLALSDGTMAVIGDLDAHDEGTFGFLLAAGAYGLGGDGLVRPLPGPAWTRLTTDHVSVGVAPHRWILDLHTGTLFGEQGGDGVRSVRFASLARPGTGALRAEGPGGITWGDALSPPRVPAVLSADHRWVAGTDGGPDRSWAETTSDRATVTVTAHQRTWSCDDPSRIERLAAVRSDEVSCRVETDAAVEDACTLGFDELLCEHRSAWAERWQRADIEIEGDPEAQLAVRFALFHLLSSAATIGEAPVGARGLTGLAYAGHVFWDTDVFVLPALAATLPTAARAVLEYRIRRLPAARAEATARGLPGARFPWESADSGSDVTPTSVRDIEGKIVPILTGAHAEHINSDVAWAAVHYVDWTGDTSLFDGEGRDLVTETARYCAARVRVDDDGGGHLDGVIGPDEYHEMVDDNAYTNQMVRWHLRHAARLAADAGQSGDVDRFTTIANALVDGFDHASGRHEQFAGFWELEPLLIGDVVEPPVAADVLLGRDRIARTQVIKQPDVLMLHHLLPGDLPAGALEADLDFYLPRIAHGSSLSPAICAAVLARAGRPDEAMSLWDLAARLDLEDLTGTTAGGLHLATMGGLWQAVAYGFAGIHPSGKGLRIDPHLPARWTSLRINLRYHGEPVVITVEHDGVTVDSDLPVPLIIRGAAATAPTHHPMRHQSRSKR
jgi:hypothetical protein